jgi:glucose-6-phosphate dehydrogenase assembly protein OpcA
MPDPAPISRGLPVTPDAIGRELARLWREGGDVTTRASLVNFVIWCRGEAALDANTELVAQFVQSHACRAIVLASDDAPGLAKPEVSAWIGAHCHISRAGAKQVCCEQVTLLARGAPEGTAAVIPNLILSHLDSDLPLYLFLQDSLPERPDPQLWAWVDRLFFDSASWGDFAGEARRFAALAERFRLIPADLNWTRLIPFRLAIVRLFEPPLHQEALRSIRSVEIVHAPGRASTALLLAGWIATRLGWGKPEPAGAGRIAAGPGEFRFSERPGDPVARCVLAGGRNEFAVESDPDACLVRSRSRVVAAAPHAEALPGLPDRPHDLLDEELTRGSRHAPYSAALGWCASYDAGRNP